MRCCGFSTLPWQGETRAILYEWESGSMVTLDVRDSVKAGGRTLSANQGEITRVVKRAAEKKLVVL